MWFLLFMAALAASPSKPGRERWTLMSGPTAYPALYFDVAGIQKRGRYSRIWVMQDFRSKYAPFGSVKFEVEFDCFTNLHRGLFYATYAAHMGEGPARDGGEAEEPWSETSLAEGLERSFACRPPAQEPRSTVVARIPY